MTQFRMKSGPLEMQRPIERTLDTKESDITFVSGHPDHIFIIRSIKDEKHRKMVDDSLHVRLCFYQLVKPQKKQNCHVVTL